MSNLPKRILMFGATGTLGQAIATRLDRNGWQLDIQGRKPETLERLRARLTVSGNQLCLDLLNGQFGDVLASLSKSYDGVVFAHGAAHLSSIGTIDSDEFNSLWRLHTMIPFEITRYLIHSRKLQQGASVVYMSTAARAGVDRGRLAYVVSKAALPAMACGFVAEYSKKFGFRFNVVSPGVVDGATRDDLGSKIGQNQMDRLVESYPMGLVTADAVSEMINFLLSDHAKYVNGQELIIDGGRSTTG